MWFQWSTLWKRRFHQQHNNCMSWEPGDPLMYALKVRLRGGGVTFLSPLCSYLHLQKHSSETRTCLQKPVSNTARRFKLESNARWLGLLRQVYVWKRERKKWKKEKERKNESHCPVAMIPSPSESDHPWVSFVQHDSAYQHEPTLASLPDIPPAATDLWRCHVSSDCSLVW